MLRPKGSSVEAQDKFLSEHSQPAALQASRQQEGQSSNTSSPGAAIAGQQQARHRNAGSSAPKLADLRSSGRGGPARSRVQQATATPDGPSAAGSSTSTSSIGASIRSRLKPLQTAGAAQAPITAPPSVSQLFSVFTNPLSSANQASAKANVDSSPEQARSRASIQSPIETKAQQNSSLHNQTDNSRDSQPGQGETTVSAGALQDNAEQQADADVHGAAQGAAQAPVSTSYSTSPGKDPGHITGTGLQRTYRFEVHAAGLEPEQLVDYNGHDQQNEQVFGAEGLQHGDSIQQYVYNEDTGQLCRMGEGTETTRVGRHYLEDCHTGEFFQLAQQPAGGWWAWLRRRPRLAAESWFRSGGGGVAADGLQQEPGFLHSLSDFLDTMGSCMAAFGMFAQGLAGGLALLCLFMTYIQYATAGRDGFLAFYSPQAEMVNRAFFTLISIALVAAASRHAFDKLGNFSPRHLRLGLVDGFVMVLYLLAYTCNLLATPLDDQLAFEARRDPSFFTLPMPAAFERKLGLWHALNLVRVISCGLAWVLVCYRSNHFVMLKVFEARTEQGREQHQHTAAPAAGAHAAGVATGPLTTGIVGAAGAGDVVDGHRRLQRMGSSIGSFGDKGRARGDHPQQQWAVPCRRTASVGGACSSGVGSVPGSDQGRSAEHHHLMVGHALSSN